jgi:glycosyltransferase involved in cell wall biosynthesis
MKEIADDGGGALLVDPRDDQSLMNAMRALLLDEELYTELRRQALSRPIRTWDSYAQETWRALAATVIDPMSAEEADPGPKV